MKMKQFLLPQIPFGHAITNHWLLFTICSLDCFWISYIPNYLVCNVCTLLKSIWVPGININIGFYWSMYGNIESQYNKVSLNCQNLSYLYCFLFQSGHIISIMMSKQLNFTTTCTSECLTRCLQHKRRTF